jgi:bifunctional non-homologous end joining protein LigD
MPRTASLRRYSSKRDFTRTPEPPGRKRPRGRSLRFVVQKHRASHLHYDFRLEADGVLKSWAVPKGPTLNPADRRLAMQVEDHPLDYRDFEGVIPPGNYGAGQVIVWDRGTYKLAEGTDPAAQIKGGKIKFVLRGRKLNGMFTLVRMRPRDGSANAWLLIKDKDADADPRWNPERHGESVKSGRTLDDLARSRHPAKWISNRPKSRWE